MTEITFYPNRIKAGCKKHIENYEIELQVINAFWKGSKLEIITKESAIAHIKSYKIIMLICTNIQNIKQLDDKKIFPLLLEKYDESLNELYDLNKKMVELDAMKEDDYRLFCETTLKNRNLLKQVCDLGEDTECEYEFINRMVRPN
jgi:hypothetical protein